MAAIKQRYLSTSKYFMLLVSKTILADGFSQLEEISPNRRTVDS